MLRLKHVKYSDLNVGDEFTWVNKLGESLPNGSTTYIFTGKRDNYISFTDSILKSRIWTDYAITYSSESRLVKVLKLSNPELVLEKIKYLDQRYKERKAA